MNVIRAVALPHYVRALLAAVLNEKVVDAGVRLQFHIWQGKHERKEERKTA
jgi:hypothetical protein